MSRYVAAYHLILTAYGFWLPNDPRGSWSDLVRAFELRKFGPATKVSPHRSLAREPHDRRLRLAAKRAMARPPVIFTGLQGRAIVRGFSDYVVRSGSMVYAGAVMPDHVHLVVARRRCGVEIVARLFKGAATLQLSREGLHPFQDLPYPNGTIPPPWSRQHWGCFLDEGDLPRVIRYVENNPIRSGYAPQHWSCITPYEQHEQHVLRESE